MGYYNVDDYLNHNPELIFDDEDNIELDFEDENNIEEVDLLLDDKEE